VFDASNHGFRELVSWRNCCTSFTFSSSYFEYMPYCTSRLHLCGLISALRAVKMWTCNVLFCDRNRTRKHVYTNVLYPTYHKRIIKTTDDRNLENNSVLCKYLEMMAGFTEGALAKKLADLNSSQQSIQTLSLWLIHHRKHHATIVKVWFRELQKGEP
jgi:hypothetical protein